jgi:hypothetical protein
LKRTTCAESWFIRREDIIEELAKLAVEQEHTFEQHGQLKPTRNEGIQDPIARRLAVHDISYQKKSERYKFLFCTLSSCRTMPNVALPVPMPIAHEKLWNSRKNPKTDGKVISGKGTRECR